MMGLKKEKLLKHKEKSGQNLHVTAFLNVLTDKCSPN